MAIVSAASPDAPALTDAETASALRKPPLTLAAMAGVKSAADVVAKLVSFAVAVLAARVLAPRDFGVFALAWTTGWLLGVASDAGMPLHLAREVARAPRRRAAVFVPSLQLRAAFGAGALVAAIAVARLSLPAPARPAFVLLVAAQLTFTTTEFVAHYFRGMSRADVESGLTVAGRLTLLGAVLLWAWRLPTLPMLGVAMLVPAAGMLTASLWAVRRLGGFDVAGTALRSRKTVLAGAWPIGAAALLSALYFRIDVFAIEYWRGSSAVGLYNAAFRIVDASRLLPAAVLAVWFPELCRSADLRPLRRLGSRLLAGGVAVAAVSYPASARLIAVIFGAAFAGAGPVLAILALSIPLLFLNYALTHQLVAWDRQRAYAGLCGAALGVNLVLNVWLVPAHGVEGAAWATLLTELAVTGGSVALLATS
ncbi:MAG TPA: oligosaccharide flippase family protein [Vicinamibacterales bacterium]|nr:oligosaccharide flippase family protein [Vicinamibacterales bacterium]